MAGKEKKENCFTILWKLENISYCLQKKKQRIKSPSFVVDEMDQTKWSLILYPRGRRIGNGIGYFLQRDSESKGADKVELKCELAFTAEDGSVLASRHFGKFEIGKGECMGEEVFQSRERVYISKRSTFLSEETLRARCRIWKGFGNMKNDVRCTAHTRIGIEKRSFAWNVKNFSTFEFDQKYTYQIKSAGPQSPLMAIDLSLTGGLNSEEIIRFTLCPRDDATKYATFKLSLVDASGNRTKCNHDEFWSNTGYKQFTFPYTKKQLLAKNSIYLPKDVLSLHWEWIFSKGVVSEDIEELLSESVNHENKMSEIQRTNIEKNLPFPSALSNNLQSFYDKQLFHDVKLKTKTKEFPAHKIILSCSSSVFNAMFSIEMQEKNGDCVNIQDLNDSTVSGMLFYIYTAHVEDLSWQRALDLYRAADKYDIQGLKNICSSYLKENLSLSNACELLSLSDSHSDDDLKSVVQVYVLEYKANIFPSDEWKLLMEMNPKLVAETLSLQ